MKKTIIKTQKNKLVVPQAEFDLIQKVSHHSARLYNYGLYQVRQYFFNNNSYLNYVENYHICKTSEHYKMLLTDTGQQILRLIERNFKSFFHLLKLKNSGKYSDKVSPPKYKREEFMIISIQGRSARIKNGFVYIGFSKTFKETYNVVIPYLKFTLPKNIKANKLQEVRIIPLYKGKEFEIEYVYKTEIETNENLKNSRYLSIDLGVNNFATCFNSTNGDSFIIDGKRIKSINHWYNKQKAKLQTIYDRQGLDINTKRFIKLSERRKHRINDFFNRAVKLITDYCIKNKIGNLVIGDFKNIKQDINLGKKNNQKFVSIPFAKFKQKLKSKCEQIGITYNSQEESYTSKCSFLDNEIIQKHPSYLGKRVKRGLFRTAKKIIVNSDVNGAANILKKFLSNSRPFRRASKGLVNNPVRVKLYTSIPPLQSPIL